MIQKKGQVYVRCLKLSESCINTSQLNNQSAMFKFFVVYYVIAIKLKLQIVQFIHLKIASGVPLTAMNPEFKG